MFGLGGRQRALDRAVNSITDVLRAQLGIYVPSGALIDILEVDAYVAGYIQWKMTALAAYCIKEDGLHPDDANVASGMALLNLFGETKGRQVSQLIKKHGSAQTSEYLDGKQKGMKAVAYTLGLKDISEDPDYWEGLVAFENFTGYEGTELRIDQKGALGLEHVWLTQRLERATGIGP